MRQAIRRLMRQKYRRAELQYGKKMPREQMMRPGNTTNEYGKVMLQAIRYDTSDGQKRKGSLISDVRSLSYGYKKKSPCKGRLFENGSCQQLQYFDGASSRTAAVIINFIADALSFVQLTQTFFFQFRNMDKYILAAVFRLNKAITFT